MLSILTSPHVFPLVVFSAASVLFGILCLRGRRSSLFARAVPAAIMACAAGFGLAGLASEGPLGLWLPPLAVACFHVVLFVFPSAEFAAALSRLRHLMTRPYVRFAAVVIVMGGAVAVSMSVTLNVLEPDIVTEFPESSETLPPVPLEVVRDVLAFTDRGRPIEVRTNPEAGDLHIDPARLKNQFDTLARLGLRDQVIHLPDGWQNCNCHGWVFTNGQFFIESEQVSGILRDNRYRPVEDPRAGDLAVYYNDDGAVTHTGIVRYVSNKTKLILVESKWGRMGRFIHPHDTHAYGRDACVFYRSARVGHRLSGLESPSPAPTREQLEQYLPRAYPVSTAE